VILDFSWRDRARRQRLEHVLQRVNHARALGKNHASYAAVLSAAFDVLAQVDEHIDADHTDPDELMDRFCGAHTRLAVYGSLAPGEKNHAVIHDIPGQWQDGYVHGEVHPVGWGEAIGYPGMTWLPHSPERVAVRLFTSPALSAHWRGIDSFEGRDYLRILVPVDGLTNGPVVANIYQVRTPATPPLTN